MEEIIEREINDIKTFMPLTESQEQYIRACLRNSYYEGRSSVLIELINK